MPDYHTIRTAADLGQLIRNARHSAGLTQTDAAGLCGVSIPFFNAIENGKATAQIDKVLSVCRQLGVQVVAYLPHSDMAMSIHGEIKPGWIDALHWQGLAKQAGVPIRLIREYAKEFAGKIFNAVEQIILLDKFTPDEQKFLRDQILPVIKQRVHDIKLALGHR